MNDPSPPTSPRRAPRAGLPFVFVRLAPRRNRLGHLAIAAGDRGFRAGSAAAPSRARRVRRLAVPERCARGSRMSAMRPAPGAIARSPRPTARTRWADRWRRSQGTEDGPPTGAAAGLPFESQGVAVHDRAPRRHACSTRRRDATRTGACLPRSRPKSGSLSARERAASPS